MLRLSTKTILFLSFVSALSLSACGGKKSSNTPNPAANGWDAKSDRNTSDLVIKDIEP